MDSVSGSSDTQIRGANIALNILSSLGTMFGSNGAPTGLFADLLSQTQVAAVSQQSTSSNAPPSSQSNSPPSANNNDTAPATAGGDSANAMAAAIKKLTPTERLLLGKLLHRAARLEFGIGKLHQKDNVKTAAPAVDNTGAMGANDSVSSDPAPNTDVTAAPVTPAVQSPTNDSTGTADSTNAAAASTDIAVATVLNADPQMAATPTDTTQPANLTTPAPVTDNNSGAAGNSNAGSTDPMAAAELLLLLVQLQRLAAQQTASASVDTNANAIPADTQNSTNSASSPAPTSGNNPPAALDLKSLLAALTGPEGIDTLSSGNSDDAATDPTTATASAATALPQNNSTAVTTTPAQPADKNNWMNAEFFNMFNATVPADNSLTPPALSMSAIAPIALSGSGGSSVDADAGGQSQDSFASRSNTAGTTTGTNSMPILAEGAHASNPYDFASQLSALRAVKGGPTGLPSAVEQVVLQLSRATKDGASQMSIQLRPAELGRIDVKLNIASDGKVQGTVVADNPQTLDLLLKDARSLERALQEAGLRADSGSLQFSLRGDSQAGNFFNSASGQSDTDVNADTSANATSLAAIADAAETYYLTPGGVNLRV